MAEAVQTGTVMAAMIRELAAQGFGNGSGEDGGDLSTYPVHGTLNVEALAEAVETALRGGDAEDAMSPAELNSANDG